MLRGLANVSFWAADHEAAKLWYTEVLGLEPYFTMPGYCEFRIGDSLDEFGIIDSAYSPTGPNTTPGGAVIYWHVDDVPAAMERLISLGAGQHEAPRDRGHGFITATVIDPFGNILGVMYNPHYLEVLASAAG